MHPKISSIINILVIADINYYRHCRRYWTFFQAVGPISIENLKFWPILASFSYFVANLRTFGGLLQA